MSRIDALNLVAIIQGAVILLLIFDGWRLRRRAAVLENAMLGVQYDIGLLAIALDNAGIAIHDDTRELAHHVRQGLAESEGRDR